MPLSINLKPRERLIINGVVIENSGNVAKILIHNQASLLREKEIITEAEANTPARRLYYAIQCQYLFSSQDGVWLPLVRQLLRDIAAATPALAPFVDEIRGRADERDFYRALKAAKQLIQKEDEAAGTGSQPR